MHTQAILLAASVTVLAMPFAVGQEATKFDMNKDGNLGTTERRAYFIHRNSPTHRKYDKDFDGRLSTSETANLEADAAQIASLDEVSYNQMHPREPETAIKVVAERFPDVSTQRVSAFDKLFGLQIRRSLTDIDPFWEDKLNNPDAYSKALPKVPPATISYARDLVTKADAWTAIGVLARPFALDDVGSTVVIPSIEFDRFQHEGDPAKERDLLIFRAGLDIGLWGIPNGTRTVEVVEPNGKGDVTTSGEEVQIIAGNRLRVNAAYKTDSGFEAETFAGEVEWETGLFGLGGFHPIEPLHLAFYPRAYVRAEFGTRADDREQSTEDQKDFFRYGPVLSLQLAPYFEKGWDDRIIATFQYYYLLSAKADHGVKNFVARLDWTLDGRGHLKLGVEYRNGALTLEDRHVESVTVGLGVAF